jgi:hypothetical protein
MPCQIEPKALPICDKLKLGMPCRNESTALPTHDTVSENCWDKDGVAAGCGEGSASAPADDDRAEKSEFGAVSGAPRRAESPPSDRGSALAPGELDSTRGS